MRYRYSAWMLEHRDSAMSSTQEDGTATDATQQLGAMSLGESVERNETNEDSTNGSPSKKCSECGKNSDTLMKCRACKCVWYCDKDCQNRHWKVHRKECKRIKKELAKRGGRLDLGTEEDLGPLPVLPPREECPICMRALPLHAELHRYMVCCGKTICAGCDLHHNTQTKKVNDERAQMQQPQVPGTCAFCREPTLMSEEETLMHFRKRIGYNDPCAMITLAVAGYGHGELGVAVDQAKCIDLLRQAASLGYPSAQHQLGNFHHNGEMGLERNEEEGFKYEKEAAEGGHLLARNNLGCTEGRNGNFAAAVRHFRLSASGGYREAMEAFITYFEFGLLRHRNLAETLQAFYLARAELRSEDRDKYIEQTKHTGKYKKEYD